MTWNSVNVDGRQVLVGVHRGRPWAIEDLCSHSSCAFSTDGEFVDGVVICECHGSEFDVFTGEALTPPASEPIVTFRCRLVDGQVEVQP